MTATFSFRFGFGPKMKVYLRFLIICNSDENDRTLVKQTLTSSVGSFLFLIYYLLWNSYQGTRKRKKEKRTQGKHRL